MTSLAMISVNIHKNQIWRCVYHLIAVKLINKIILEASGNKLLEMVNLCGWLIQGQLISDLIETSNLIFLDFFSKHLKIKNKWSVTL